MSNQQDNDTIRQSYNLFASFYGRDFRLHFTRDTIRALGCPRYISIKVNKDMTSFIILPAVDKDVMSFRVPENLFHGSNKMRISSQGFIVDMFQKNNWNMDASYRVDGRYLPKNNVVMYDLADATCFTD